MRMPFEAQYDDAVRTRASCFSVAAEEEEEEVEAAMRAEAEAVLPLPVTEKARPVGAEAKAAAAMPMRTKGAILSLMHMERTFCEHGVRSPCSNVFRA